MGASTWQNSIFPVKRSKNDLMNVKVSLRLVKHGVLRRENLGNLAMVTLSKSKCQKKCQIFKKEFS